MRHKRVIIDGNNPAHMYRHVYGHLSNKRGKPTGVIYGFLNLLHRVNETFCPDEIFVAWDCDGPSARSIVYQDYKAGRKDKSLTEEEKDRLKLFFDVEIPMLKEMLTKLGIPQLQHKLLEADDIIALCVTAPGDTSEWVIVSNDKDYVQWVKRNKCRLLTPTSDYLFFQEEDGSVQGGKTEFGLSLPSPETYALWRAMIGDKSDSIPGIPGIGPGTVYSCFVDKPPIWSSDIDNEKQIIKYIRSGEFKGARAGKIYEAGVKKCETRDTILTTLAMMRPTQERILKLLDEARTIAGVSSKRTRRFVENQSSVRRGTYKEKTDVPLALYLRNHKRDPNHFVMFLRSLGFEMAYYKNTWYPILQSFYALHVKHKFWMEHTQWSPCDDT